LAYQRVRAGQWGSNMQTLQNGDNKFCALHRRIRLLLPSCDVGTWKGWTEGLLVVLGVVPASPERGGQHFPLLELVTSAADTHGHGVGTVLLRAHHARADTLGFIGTRHTAIERFIGVEVEEQKRHIGRVYVILILRHF